MTTPHTVTLIPGDGIGPEITESVRAVVEALKVPIVWDVQLAGMAAFNEKGNPLPVETVRSFRETGVCLKGPLTTVSGGGYQSVNVQLRSIFDLYANVRPVKTFVGVESRYTDVDLVIVRENTEGEYTGIEHYITPEKDIAEAISIISRRGCERIVKHAYHLASQRRKKLALVHKANILKLTQGMFLESGRYVAQMLDGGVEVSEFIVDNAAMQLVLRPTRFDVLVTTNLFGDILSDLTAGLIGGLGLTGSGNYGMDQAMFEAVHGSAPDIAGKGVANPTAMLMATTMMLRHLGYGEEADKLEHTVRYVIASGVETTPDIGGKGSTQSFTRELVKWLTT